MLMLESVASSNETAGNRMEPSLPSPSFEQFSVQAQQECRAKLEAQDVTYTLVTQCSTDRLWMMEHHCRRWGSSNPISLAVYYVPNKKSNETVTAESAHVEIVDQLTTNLGCHPNQLSVQIIFPPLRPAHHYHEFSNDHYDDDMVEYPINALRNTALAAVQTSHVVFVDVDFWPSIDLHDVLMSDATRNALTTTETEASSSSSSLSSSADQGDGPSLIAEEPWKRTLVIPAFQLLRKCPESRKCPEDKIPIMPDNKEELLELFKQRELSPFDPFNRGGHGSTLYQDWLLQTSSRTIATHELLSIPCVLSNRYEPYLVFQYCKQLPPFQTAFTGYGKNKITWVMQLIRSGYTMQQIPKAFVVHYPHLKSAARSVWNGGRGGQQLNRRDVVDDDDTEAATDDEEDVVSQNLLQYKRGMVDRTFVLFRTWLEKAVPNQRVLPKCSSGSMNDDAALWVAHRKKKESSNETAGNRMEPSLASPHTAGVISPRKTSGLRRHIEGGSNATSPLCQIFAASILDNWLSSRRLVCGSKEEGMVRVEEFVLDTWKGYEKIVRRYRNAESYGMTGEIEVGRKGKNGTADDCLSSNTKIETGHTSPLSSSSVALSANEGGEGEELFEVIDYPIIRIRPFDFYNSYERFHAYLNVAMVMMMFENDNITNPQLVFMTPDFRLIPEGDKDMWRTFSDREPVFGLPSEEQQQQQKSETSSGKNNDTTTTTKRKRYRYKDLIEAPNSGTSMLVVPSRGRDHHCKSELFRGILRWMKQNQLGVHTVDNMYSK